MHIYVDGDIFVYRAAYATEYPKYSVVIGEDEVREFQYKKEAVAFRDAEHSGAEILVETILEPLPNALSVMDSMLKTIAYHFGVDPRSLHIVLSGPNNFRKDVAFTKPYKGNRKEKPTHYEGLRDHLLENYVTYVTDGEEADDYLGYTQYQHYTHDSEDASCIVTFDKDLDQIPGLHYNPVTEHQYFVDDDAANAAFLAQLLSGDSTDNIPGVPGLGEGKAAKILEGLSEGPGLGAVIAQYRKAYGDEWLKVFDEQAQLLWIRRQPLQHWKDYWGEQWEAQLDSTE